MANLDLVLPRVGSNQAAPRQMADGLRPAIASPPSQVSEQRPPPPGSGMNLNRTSAACEIAGIRISEQVLHPRDTPSRLVRGCMCKLNAVARNPNTVMSTSGVRRTFDLY